MKTLTKLMLCTAVALPLAQAQKTTFKTRSTDVILNPEGSVKLPFDVQIVEGSDRSKWEELTKPYANFMANGITQYTGRAGSCGQTFYTGLFLPGNTEAEFRSAEKVVVTTYQRDSSKVLGYKAATLLKKYGPGKVTNNVTGTLYILKSNPASKVHNHYMHGYFYDRKLNQGVLMICAFIPSR